MSDTGAFFLFSWDFAILLSDLSPHVQMFQRNKRYYLADLPVLHPRSCGTQDIDWTLMLIG